MMIHPSRQTQTDQHPRLGPASHETTDWGGQTRSRLFHGIEGGAGTSEGSLFARSFEEDGDASTGVDHGGQGARAGVGVAEAFEADGGVEHGLASVGLEFLVGLDGDWLVDLFD